jgi:hypothetical protein
VKSTIKFSLKSYHKSCNIDIKKMPLRRKILPAASLQASLLEVNNRPFVRCPGHFTNYQFGGSFFCHRVGMGDKIVLPVQMIGCIMTYSGIVLVSLNH